MFPDFEFPTYILIICEKRSGHEWLTSQSPDIVFTFHSNTKNDESTPGIRVKVLFPTLLSAVGGEIYGNAPDIDVFLAMNLHQWELVTS